jgi:hypothetical protein
MTSISIGSIVLDHESSTRPFATIESELRRGWRRIHRTSLIFALIDRLFRKERRSAIERTLDSRAAGSMDFVTHTLLAWVLCDADDHKGTKLDADEQSVQRLLNLTWELSSSREAIAVICDDPFLAMRNIAVQQFSAQENQLQSAFGRMWVIFSDLQPNHRLRLLVEETTGMPLRDVLALILLFSMTFLQSPPSQLKARMLRYAQTAFSTHPKLRSLLIAYDGTGHKKAIERPLKVAATFMPSPFVRYPLINLNGRLVVIDPVSAAKTGEHFVARIVEEFGEQDHKQELTRLYESYANQRAQAVLPEGVLVNKELRRLVVTGKVCDQYIRIREGTVLLVEIKSGFLSDQKTVALSGTHLESALKNVLEDAFKQLANTRDHLLDAGRLLPNDRVTMLLVTRENFRLPQVATLRTMMPNLDALLTQIDGHERSEYCICCLDEYDELLDLHRTGDISLSDFFSDGAVSGDKPIRSRTGLAGRLRTSARIHVAEHLHNAIDEASDHAGNLLTAMIPDQN